MQEYYELLRATSRTFAVGIEALPVPLRDAITVAYLVLRVSDYFEDSPTLSGERKESLLEGWAQLVQSAGDAPPPPDRIRQLEGAVAEADRSLPDHEAARQAGFVLEGLAGLPSVLRRPIQHHTADTTMGMARWVRRGPDFPDEEALDDYMFEVAGRVGLLLTDTFAAFSPAIARRREALDRTAVSFGLGLQTVNVIRGLHEDPRRGWSFVPRTILPDGATGPDGFLDPRTLPREEQEAVLDFLTRKAAGHVSDALAYCKALPRRERGVRLFCIIPAVLASRTVQISAGNLQVFQRGVKVTRPQVRRIVLAARLFWFSNARLDREARELAALTQRQEPQGAAT
jgi:farnesyl-diphosphate farnesyltransferase